jgi:ADP-ribose pyrophosphatase YjhB (NUDIX family)
MMVRREVQGIIFDIVNGEEMVLLVKKKDRRNRRFYWRLLKGGIENNESEVEALKREIFEETGLKKVYVVKRVYGYEFVFRGVKHVVSSFLVKADSTEAIRLQKTEIAETVWLPKNQALKTLYWKNEKEALKRLDIQELL